MHVLVKTKLLLTEKGNVGGLGVVEGCGRMTMVRTMVRTTVLPVRAVRSPCRWCGGSAVWFVWFKFVCRIQLQRPNTYVWLFLYKRVSLRTPVLFVLVLILVFVLVRGISSSVSSGVASFSVARWLVCVLLSFPNKQRAEFGLTNVDGSGEVGLKHQPVCLVK